MEKKSFNKENVTELFSQIVKVLERDIKTPAAKEIVKNIKQISSKAQEEIKKSKGLKKEDDEVLMAKVRKIIKNKS